MDTSELSQANFTQPPEVLYSVNVVVSICKFILAMLDSIMLFITKISQSVVGLKSVGVNDRSRVGFTLDNGQKLSCRAVFDDLGVNLISSFEHPENRCFTACAPTTFTSDSTSSEIALIEFNLAVLERALGLAKLGNTLA